MNETKEQMNEMLKTAVQAIEEKKGIDVTVLCISKVTVIADYFVIATAENDRQLEALSESVKDALGRKGFDCRSVEGFRRSGWVLFDYGDLIIHLFNRETRAFYDLERIYRDAEKIDPKSL